VRDALDLDRILFVPAALPPHKLGIELAPAADRLAMVERAIATNPAFAVSDVELRRGGPSYTVDTLDALQAPDQELFLIMGSEMFLDLLSWHEPQRLAGLARLVVVPRHGIPFDPESPAALKVLEEIGMTAFATSGNDRAPAGSVFVVHATSLPISASDLRERLRRRRSIAYRTPDAVIDYIRAHGLYGAEVAA